MWSRTQAACLPPREAGQIYIGLRPTGHPAPSCVRLTRAFWFTARSVISNVSPWTWRDSATSPITLLMSLFDFYIMVDWSGAARRRGQRSDTIGVAHGSTTEAAP